MAANANGKRRKGFAKVSQSLQQQIQSMRSAAITAGGCDLSEPPLCGADDVVPRRLDRIRRLGNAVVPKIPEAIGRAIMQAEGF